MNFTLRAIGDCFSEYRLAIIGFKTFVDSKFNGVIEFVDYGIPTMKMHYVNNATELIRIDVTSVYVTNVNELKICGNVNNKEYEITYNEMDMYDVLTIINDIIAHIANNGTDCDKTSKMKLFASSQQKHDLLEMLKKDDSFLIKDISIGESHDLIKLWLYDIDLSGFLLEKEYKDISWFKVNGVLYDGDSLWDDYMDFASGWLSN